MVKIIGKYRWFDGAKFDHSYYQKEHMRLTRELLLPLGLQRLESDKTLSGTPLKTGQVVASSNAYFESLPAAQAALAQTGAQLVSDVSNYTNIRPELHICEVAVYM